MRPQPNGLTLPREAPATAQLDSGAVMQPKVRTEKTGQLQLHYKGAMAGSLCSGKKIQLMGGVRKAAELEFPLVPPGVAIIQGSDWKAKRAADWEKSAGWKPLTTSLSPSVE